MIGGLASSGGGPPLPLAPGGIEADIEDEDWGEEMEELDPD